MLTCTAPPGIPMAQQSSHYFEMTITKWKPDEHAPILPAVRMEAGAEI